MKFKFTPNQETTKEFFDYLRESLYQDLINSKDLDIPFLDEFADFIHKRASNYEVLSMSVRKELPSEYSYTEEEEMINEFKYYLADNYRELSEQIDGKVLQKWIMGIQPMGNLSEGPITRMALRGGAKLGVAAAAIAAVVYGVNKLRQRAQRECFRLKGEEKNRCMTEKENRIRAYELGQLQRALKNCPKDKNPEGCKKKIEAKIKNRI